MPIGLLFWVGIAAFGGAVYLIRIVYLGLCWLVAGLMTPKDHRRCGEYGESKGARELGTDGFDIRPDFSMNAFAKAKAKHK